MRYYLLSMLMLALFSGFQPLFTMNPDSKNNNNNDYSQCIAPVIFLLAGAAAGTISAYRNSSSLAQSFGLIADINQPLLHGTTLAAGNFAAKLPLSAVPEWVLTNSQLLQKKAFLLGLGSIISFFAANMKSKEEPNHSIRIVQLKKILLYLLTFYLAYKSALYLNLPSFAFKDLSCSIGLAQLYPASKQLVAAATPIEISLSTPRMTEATAEQSETLAKSWWVKIVAQSKFLQTEVGNFVSIIDKYFGDSLDGSKPTMLDNFS